MTDGRQVPLDTSGLEIMPADECVQRLRDASVGRLGLSAGALPIILPVNFAVHEASVVFCTEEGAKLSAARAGDVACLEIDDADAMSHEGWSVIVTGRLREITDPEELSAARRLPLAPWKPTAAPHHVALAMELLSGRRLNQLHRAGRR